MSLSGWHSAVFFLALAGTAGAQETPLRLALPTANQALLTGHFSEFYQVIERNLHGVISHPWEGGRYGFVRDPVPVGGGTVYTRFHEGMDIKPLQRDAAGEPLDEVRAIASGKVVYTTTLAGASNYGRYVVVEHRWGGCPYFSLYAHLKTIAVATGDVVRQGDKLGVMGHTGSGLDRARAHVHVELNLLLNTHFGEWHATFFKGELNRHGLYNGINLAGLDLPRLFLALRADPEFTIPKFLGREEVFFKVIVPNTPNFQLPARYPWMIAGGAPNEKPAAWEVSCTRSGLPVGLTPRAETVSAPQVSFVKAGATDARYLTRGLVTGRGASARLTDSGQRYFRLLTFPD
ncbi:MAG: M23 family metallopeptidase [Chthoniobacterales bacterium]